MNKKICLIHTGGTIGMKLTSRGYAPVEGFLREAIATIGDMKIGRASCRERV